jgi:hypothetical protein
MSFTTAAKTKDPTPPQRRNRDLQTATIKSPALAPKRISNAITSPTAQKTWKSTEKVGKKSKKKHWKNQLEEGAAERAASDLKDWEPNANMKSLQRHRESQRERERDDDTQNT